MIRLKDRLSFYSVLIFGVMTLVICAIVYVSYYRQMRQREFQSLSEKSLLAAFYYLEEDELSNSEHEHIKDQLTKTISRSNIAVINREFNVFLGEMDSVDLMVPTEKIAYIFEHKSSAWESDNHFFAGIFYHDNQGDFVVLTRTSKASFQEHMYSLLRILLFASLLGVFCIYFLSRYLATVAYAPIQGIIQQINSKDNRNFDTPIQLQRSYLEIQDLVATYNNFVDKIAQTFAVQKNFIDYVSHELRTPMTALMGTVEVTEQKPRSVDEYRAVLSELRQYVRELQDTLEQMTLLSGANTDFEMKPLRIDEVIWSAIESVIRYHQAQISVDIGVTDHQVLTWRGNEKLLQLALSNLLENAVKYSSNKPIKVRVERVEQTIRIEIIDQGIGIDEEDLEHIFENFYRGKHTESFQGKGIGLSMASIIFKIHDIAMEIHSVQGETKIALHYSIKEF